MLSIRHDTFHVHHVALKIWSNCTYIVLQGRYLLITIDYSCIFYLILKKIIWIITTILVDKCKTLLNYPIIIIILYINCSIAKCNILEIMRVQVVVYTEWSTIYIITLITQDYKVTISWILDSLITFSRSLKLKIRLIINFKVWSSKIKSNILSMHE